MERKCKYTDFLYIYKIFLDLDKAKKMSVRQCVATDISKKFSFCDKNRSRYHSKLTPNVSISDQPLCLMSEKIKLLSAMR